MSLPRMKCPACGTMAAVTRDSLGRQLRCPACQKRFRLHSGGRAVETGATPAARQRRGSGLRWRAVVASWTVLLAVLGWSWWPHGRAETVLLPLPDDLAARAEIFGQAWLGRDLVTMRRLTGREFGRSLRSWLRSHPAPEGGGAERRCTVRVLRRKGSSARLALRPMAETEVQQTWLKEADAWVFVPNDARKQARR